MEWCVAFRNAGGRSFGGTGGGITNAELGSLYSLQPTPFALAT
eukprot:CAMPEP_0172808282 /NCGR_PEP_ID=MMETSP1075-20121228/7581_1 /TAXON_ID=2916 /ORGANISM="Ceratium fusus, Strain PA161109" /LENGTH=42 /DNA_ID= /DNA_START= /DNA_END= /DNA_ORIENTATION=